MASKIANVQILDLSSKKWWWKERNVGEGFGEATDELSRKFSLDEGGEGVWQAADREIIKENWLAATRFPSEVHVELLERKVIPHPYVAFNEHQVQWVGETEWLYTCTFDAPATNEGSHKLSFDGLDTLCDVYLNGEKILQTDNAFRQWVFDTKNDEGILKATDNELLLHFKCAKAYAKAEEAVRGKVRAGSTNLGDPSRVYLRKPQYDWRWDWGPELMTCGPYRNITLCTYTARVQDFSPQATLESIDPTNQKFKFHLTSTLTLAVTRSTASLIRDKASDIPFEIVYAVKGPNGDEIIASGRQKVSKKDVEGHLALSDGAYVTLELPPLVLDEVLEGNAAVKPWWPVGYGDQNLYTFEIKLITPDGGTIDSVSRRIGWRSVELIQDPLEEPDRYGTGTTFFFKVNGVEMFMGGSNWIPADNFLTTISDERYRRWLTLLRDGGQNMVRIWGGGIYEPDIFYDICDELGILVWQDFQFACGVYPAHDAFVDSVREEAVYNVSRLKHHPSIALFCGNNEDYQMVLQWGDVAHLPALVIYEEVLPQVVGELTGGLIPYHRGSPYGGKGWDTADPTIGDVHQWNIWGGKELPWQEYPRLGGRFVSEFGIPSFPSMKTIGYWMEGVDPREWYAQSKVMAQHTRAGAFERRFAIVMNENFRLTADLKKHVFNTRLMQAEAIGLAYRTWKREWKKEGKRYCGGVLVWQFNDCWPVTSWSLVDYFLRAKPSFYVVARELAPITVSISREVVQNRDNDRPKQFYEYGATRSTGAKLHIWATRDGTGSLPSTPLEVRLDIQYFDLENPDWHHRHAFEHTTSSIFKLSPNEATELGTFGCPEPDLVQKYDYKLAGTTSSGRVVVSARLLHPETGETLARFVDWPQPYRLLDIPTATAAAVQINVNKVAGSDSAATVRVTVNRPVKCLMLFLDGHACEGARAADDFESPKWSDNALDVVPFDPQLQPSSLHNNQAHRAMEGTHFLSTSPTACHHLPTKKPRVRWIHTLFRHLEVSPRPNTTTDHPPPKIWHDPSTKSSLLDLACPPGNDQEYTKFLHQYPEYRLTHPLDALRKSDFARLEKSGETYVDYMGGTLYPETLITKHFDFLKGAVLGNTHSINNSSQASSRCASEARSAVLAFFNAPPEYTVVFTANASAALKLVGESFPFHDESAFVLAVDSHNSINGIREFASAKGAHCAYIPSTPTGGFTPSTAQAILLENRPQKVDSGPCLFALTGQSNISNWKAPLDIAHYASSLGYHVLLDGAALAPSTSFSLSNHPSIDAMAVSFYKMFGFPTGIGALVVKKSFLARLKRPWFAGGTVDVVQVPGMGVTRAEHLHEQFEDGTINYTMLSSITEGLRFLSSYLPYLPLRLSCLLNYLTSSLSRVQHDVNGKDVVQVLSRRSNPAERIDSVGGQSEVGSLVSLIFLDPAGKLLPNAFIEYAASVNCISLRTGCACNPGAAMAMLGIPEVMDSFGPGQTQREVERKLGRDTGVVRISLGLASNFEDVQRVIRFVALIASSSTRERMYNEWTSSRHQ